MQLILNTLGGTDRSRHAAILGGLARYRFFLLSHAET